MSSFKLLDFLGHLHSATNPLTTLKSTAIILNELSNFLCISTNLKLVIKSVSH
ncbi:hypothetical protein J2X77_002395 [Sphingobacterium sp. 2149]|nr:hypothetical protein [Sphingobacterium sp. 2149]